MQKCSLTFPHCGALFQLAHVDALGPSQGVDDRKPNVVPRAVIVCAGVACDKEVCRSNVMSRHQRQQCVLSEYIRALRVRHVT